MLRSIFTNCEPTTYSFESTSQGEGLLGVVRSLVAKVLGNYDRGSLGWMRYIVTKGESKKRAQFPRLLPPQEVLSLAFFYTFLGLATLNILLRTGFLSFVQGKSTIRDLLYGLGHFLAFTPFRRPKSTAIWSSATKGKF